MVDSLSSFFSTDNLKKLQQETNSTSLGNAALSTIEAIDIFGLTNDLNGDGVQGSVFSQSGLNAKGKAIGNILNAPGNIAGSLFSGIMGTQNTQTSGTNAANDNGLLGGVSNVLGSVLGYNVQANSNNNGGKSTDVSGGILGIFKNLLSGLKGATAGKTDSSKTPDKTSAQPQVRSQQDTTSSSRTGSTPTTTGSTPTATGTGSSTEIPQGLENNTEVRTAKQEVLTDEETLAREAKEGFTAESELKTAQEKATAAETAVAEINAKVNQLTNEYKTALAAWEKEPDNITTTDKDGKKTTTANPNKAKLEEKKKAAEQALQSATREQTKLKAEQDEAQKALIKAREKVAAEKVEYKAAENELNNSRTAFSKVVKEQQVTPAQDTGSTPQAEKTQERPPHRPPRE